MKLTPIKELVTKCKTWNPRVESIREISYIDLGSIDKDQKRITSIEIHAAAEAPSRAKQLVHTDDVLVATVRPNLNGVATVTPEYNGMTASTGYCVLRANRDKLNSEYLFQWVKSPQFIKKMMAVATGASYPAVSDTKVKTSTIPLPPLDEQKRIAAILDAADELRTKRRQTLLELDTLIQSTFLDMFGDPVTNPKGWDTVTFPQIGKFVSGATPSKKNEAYWNGDVPWVSPKDMKRDFIDSSIDTITELALSETSIKQIPPNHLLVVVRGMILAHTFPVALNTTSITINQDMKAITPSDLFLSSFLLYCMKVQQRGILAAVSTAAHGTKKFDQKSMEETYVIAPPLALQQQFANIVEKIEAQKSRCQAHLDELDTLFASLQSRAFKGEL